MPRQTQPQRPEEPKETKSVYASAIRQEMRTMEGMDAMLAIMKVGSQGVWEWLHKKTYRKRNRTDTAIAGLQDRPSHHRNRRTISDILVRRPHDKTIAHHFQK